MNCNSCKYALSIENIQSSGWLIIEVMNIHLAICYEEDGYLTEVLKIKWNRDTLGPIETDGPASA